MTRFPTQVRLTQHDRHLIAKLQCDFMNELPSTVQRRILSISDVLRAGLRSLAHWRERGELERAYNHLLIEVASDSPSEPFKAPDRD